MPFSIVIPAFNEREYIFETIETISKLLSSVEIEVIVVDNASTDGTAEILAGIDNIKVISLPQKVTVAKARNSGWREARYFFVAFIDGDMIVTSEWVAEMQKVSRSISPNALMVTGCKCLPSRQPSWLETVWFDNNNYRHTIEKYINSGNLITTKALLQKIDGFDEALITGEDVDFCIRAKAAGAALDVNKGFKIYHEGYPKTLGAFLRRERWHGVGDFSSWKYFIRSKVAICSLVATISFIFAAVLLLSGRAWFFIPLMAALSLVVLTAHYKFRVDGIGKWLKIYFLQAFYFLGRSLSIFARRKI